MKANKKSPQKSLKQFTFAVNANLAARQELLELGVTEQQLILCERVGLIPTLLQAAGGKQPVAVAACVEMLVTDPDDGEIWKCWPEYVREIASAAAELRVPPQTLKSWVFFGAIEVPGRRIQPRASRGLRNAMGDRPARISPQEWSTYAPALLNAGFNSEETAHIIGLPKGHPGIPTEDQIETLRALYHGGL